MLTILLILMFLVVLPALQGAERLDIKLRVYEGVRQGTVDPAEFVTSSYIQPTITANLSLGMDLEKERSQIMKVFNLADVKVLTETELQFGAEKGDSVRHHFRLNSHSYEVRVLLKEWGAGGRFLVLVNEQAQEEGEKRLDNVLTTEMLLHGGHSAVFGFEDRRGKPYFVSFLITGPADKILPPPPPPPPAPAPPAPPVDPEKIKEFEEGAVKATDAIDPPKLVRKVDPVYPEAARRAGKMDTVILNVRTDKEGEVERVLVLKGKYPDLNMAAVEAVKKWRYKPYIKDGDPQPVVFSVAVNFQLREKTQGAVEAGGDIESPQLIKRVDPVYPEEARKAGIQGSVILYVTTDAEGHVRDVEVLKSIPALDKAAVDAVRQWVYEPYLQDGVAKPVSFSITVQFRLQ
jgi:TonB family protein